jgi:hypothetical protein
VARSLNPLCDTIDAVLVEDQLRRMAVLVAIERHRCIKS